MWRWRNKEHQMLPVNTITLIFITSTCFCVFRPYSRAAKQYSYQHFKQNEAIRNDSPRYEKPKIMTSRQNKDLKYILLWTSEDYHPFSIMLESQNVFLKYECPEVHCYITANRTLFKDDLTKFDAILFNGRNIHSYNKKQLPLQRSFQQRYIFICMESAQNYPVCTKTFDNFFNWTVTYRLDSDIPLTYISIKNSAGKHVGPKINMEWSDRTSTKIATKKLYLKTLKRKRKAAAWFVSNCKDKSDRMSLAKKLQRSLNLYNLTIDIYGNCGTLKCPRNNSKCGMLLENDYFFYLSFENSLCEDYVTEKLLTAVEHFTIPIVYGGANYSRFLPPYSYIDGNAMSTQDIAALMHRLIQSPKLYLEYMWWRDHYSYHDAFRESICNVCSALHDETMLEKQTVYTNFREWWYPEYQKECRDRDGHEIANNIAVLTTNGNNIVFLLIDLNEEDASANIDCGSLGEIDVRVTEE